MVPPVDGRVDFLAVDKPVAFCYGWLRPHILSARGAVEGLVNNLNPCAFALLRVFIATMLAMIQRRPVALLLILSRLGAGSYVPVFAGRGLSMATYAAMYLGMFLAMLAQRNEYSQPQIQKAQVPSSPGME